MLLIGVVAAGLAVHFAAADSAATDIAGDALYAVMAYLIVVVAAPQWPSWTCGAVAAAWCVSVELLQLSEVPARLSAIFPPAALVFGAAFDVRDLVIYVAAIALCATVDAAMRRLVRLRSVDI